MIIATAPNRAALEAELAKDPYRVKNLARYDITEFEARTLHPALKGIVS